MGAAELELSAEEVEYVAARQRPFDEKYGVGRIALAALGLGVVGGSHGVLLVQCLASNAPWASRARTTAWSLYAVLLCSFHTLEFVSTALFKWRDLSYDSFLINHSLAYTAALSAGVLEFLLEGAYFSPPAWSVALGLLLVLAGQALRFVAMATAKEHFAHRIMTRKVPEHRLVTHGVYSVLRHPAYTGWFWWSIGTQLLLANPLCAAGYAWASWSFFNDRIPYEEATLLAFYPDEYPAYIRRTWIAIPFVSTALS